MFCNFDPRVTRMVFFHSRSSMRVNSTAVSCTFVVPRSHDLQQNQEEAFSTVHTYRIRPTTYYFKQKAEM